VPITDQYRMPSRDVSTSHQSHIGCPVVSGSVSNCCDSCSTYYVGWHLTCV